MKRETIILISAYIIIIMMILVVINWLRETNKTIEATK